MVRLRPTSETPRSIQLYGVDPATVGKAVRDARRRGRRRHPPDHIDLNFGCPVPKVTRKGGGAALPWRAAAVRATSCGRRRARPATCRSPSRCASASTPTTSPTSTPAGSPQDEGAAAIALHGRTAAQLYSGTADWAPIARLVESRRHPGARQRRHLGGRRRAAHGRRDRLRGRRRRPRLPGPAVAVRRPGRRLRRAAARALPTLREVAAIMRRHAELLGDGAGRAARLHRLPQARGLVPQGLLGRLGRAPRAGDGQRLRRAGRRCSPASPTSRTRSPSSAARAGAPARPRPVALPEGWLADRDDPRPPAGAELDGERRMSATRPVPLRRGPGAAAHRHAAPAQRASARASSAAPSCSPSSWSSSLPLVKGSAGAAVARGRGGASSPR